MFYYLRRGTCGSLSFYGPAHFSTWIWVTTLVVSYFGILLLYIQEHVLFIRLNWFYKCCSICQLSAWCSWCTCFYMPVFTVPQERTWNTFRLTDHSLNTFNNNNKKKINRKALLNNFHLNAAIHRLKGLNQPRSKALLNDIQCNWDVKY